MLYNTSLTILQNVFKCCNIHLNRGGVSMAGRPPKADKKIREAIYFEPHLLEWLKERADVRKTTTSAIINFIVEERMNKEKSRSKE
jgi:hypothetical protein